MSASLRQRERKPIDRFESSRAPARLVDRGPPSCKFGRGRRLNDCDIDITIMCTCIICVDMSVEHGAYEGAEVEVKNDRLLDATELTRLVADIGAENGTVLHTTGRASLITDFNRSGHVQISSVDSEPARVRMYDTEIIDGKLHYTDMSFDSLNMARLAYGLWVDCGPFSQPEGDAVPVEVATSGQESIAAYLRIGSGYPNSRQYVASQMDVRENTVSNYCNRVRWEPCDSRDRVVSAVHDMDGEFTQAELEAQVDASTNTVRTVLGEMYNHEIAEPVDDNSEQWRVIE